MPKPLVNPSKPQLQELNEELENYFANTIIPQLFVDADFILRKFTPPAMKLFTFTNADINKDIHHLADNIKYPTLIENITEVIKSSKTFEKEVQTTDNRWFQMNILPYIIRKENRTNGVIITFVDITNRIATLKELEKLNADHETFMYAVSHDIKQPLSTIVLIADLLEHTRTNNNTEQFTKGIETLKRAATNMKIILDDFTEHFKSKTGPSMQNERLNIETICQDVILALRDQIHNKGVTISTQFKTSEIFFSTKNLRSIVYNLLTNAIKYKKPDKPIKILIKTQKIKDYVLLSIVDNGIGIDKKDHKAIFKKFSRIKSKTKIEGTGMGLYIVSRMIKNNHGKIELESTPGKGSTFKVYFKYKS
ncbi:MAG: HAMP domain-containing sensor histidine kinase [Ginsengibacter sp.]